MNLLIDTHFLIWAAVRPRQVEPWARQYLEPPANTIFVSAASIYEISIKFRAGKLPEVADFEPNLLENIATMGYALLDLNPEVMLRAARFPARHGDPFDRMIAAQAIHLDLPLLSVDPKLDIFGARRLHPPAIP